MKKEVKITSYWDQPSAEKLLSEANRTGIAAASLIRFHTLRSLNAPGSSELAGSQNKESTRDGMRL